MALGRQHTILESGLLPLNHQSDPQIFWDLNGMELLDGEMGCGGTEDNGFGIHSVQLGGKSAHPVLDVPVWSGNVETMEGSREVCSKVELVSTVNLWKQR